MRLHCHGLEVVFPGIVHVRTHFEYLTLGYALPTTSSSTPAVLDSPVDNRRSRRLSTYACSPDTQFAPGSYPLVVQYVVTGLLHIQRTSADGISVFWKFLFVTGSRHGHIPCNHPCPTQRHHLLYSRSCWRYGYRGSPLAFFTYESSLTLPIRETFTDVWPLSLSPQDDQRHHQSKPTFIFLHTSRPSR